MVPNNVLVYRKDEVDQNTGVSITHFMLLIEIHSTPYSNFEHNNSTTFKTD